MSIEYLKLRVPISLFVKGNFKMIFLSLFLKVVSHLVRISQG